MKRRMLWIFLAGLIIGFAVAALYRHFVTDSIMDGGGGMENPEYLEILDGDRSYIDNSALWPVLEGTWESSDGRWLALIDEGSGLELRLGGETVLSCGLSFTYLQPGRNLHTELYPDSRELRSADAAVLSEIVYLCHESGEGDGMLRMELELPDGTNETIKLLKIKE